MSYQAKVKKYCAKHNITIDDYPRDDTYDLCVTTPKGKALVSLGDHSAVTHIYKEPGITKEDAWESVWEDLSMGLQDCTVKDCEICAGL